MITVSISGRKATLLKTADLPSGNDNSIKVNFIFKASDPVWNGATKVAIFTTVTARGLRKTLPAVIDGDGECLIPGKILSTPFSKVSVGAMATYEDGSTASTNLVFINKTDAGAGGDNIFDEEELPIDKNDFEMFMAELAASIGVQVNELNTKFETLDPLAESLEINEDGNLEVNDREVMDHASYFHNMSRYSEAFSVPTYWDLLEYDDSYVEGVDEESGLPITHLKIIDLRPGTLDGDRAIVRKACGNYLRPYQIENLAEFIPQKGLIYPVIHFWNSNLPAPERGEEDTYAYAAFQTYDGKEYTIARFYSTDFSTWVIALDISDVEGTFYYSWEDISLLEKDSYVLIKDDHKVGRADWPEFWPLAVDVKCVDLDYPEKLSGIMFNHDPRNDHSPGIYTYSSERERWVRKKDDMYTTRFMLESGSLSWGERKTLMMRGVTPTDLITVESYGNHSVKFTVVNVGYGHFTIEASETITEDLNLYINIKNTVDRCDTYGLWSEW